MAGYSTLTDSIETINNGLLHDVKLTPQKDIDYHPGLSTLFNNTQEISIKGIQEKSELDKHFFQMEIWK